MQVQSRFAGKVVLVSRIKLFWWDHYSSYRILCMLQKTTTLIDLFGRKFLINVLLCSNVNFWQPARLKCLLYVVQKIHTTTFHSFINFLQCICIAFLIVLTSVESRHDFFLSRVISPQLFTKNKYLNCKLETKLWMKFKLFLQVHFFTSAQKSRISQLQLSRFRTFFDVFENWA